MSKIIDEVRNIADPIVQKLGCELWNVEYVKEAGEWYLRVYIDRPDGISIDLCEAVSRELDPLLDEREDLIPGSYIFEVSSAGAERWLRGPVDLERFSGRLVEVKLYKAEDGAKTFSGNLAAWDENGVELDMSGSRKAFAKTAVAGVRLKLSNN
jgi:ribosome maturation factor RimP